MWRANRVGAVWRKLTVKTRISFRGLGIASVLGFQGDASFKDKRHVIATLKHFAAHGQPEAGMNCGPVDVSERVLREAFLYPFKEVLHQAGAISVMASYNEIDGVPSHASFTWLLRDVLRKEWGFTGFVVSDYYAIWELGLAAGHAWAPCGEGPAGIVPCWR